MSRETNSESLRLKIRLTSGPRDRASQALWSHPQLGELFPWAILRAYMITHVTVPLMKAAQNRAEALATDDAVAGGLADYLEHHISEEIGHDDQFLEDLIALGMAEADVRAKLPWPSLACLTGLQYYWILHHHPIVFVSYMATLEGTCVPIEKIRQVQAQTGLPSAGFRTLIWHTLHDSEHTADLDRVLDGLPLTSEQMALIGVNVAHTHNLLARSVHEMIADFEEHNARAA